MIFECSDCSSFVVQEYLCFVRTLGCLSAMPLVSKGLYGIQTAIPVANALVSHSYARLCIKTACKKCKANQKSSITNDYK